MFDRSSRKEVTLEASREVAKPKTMLKPRKVKSPHRNCCYPTKWHLLIIFSNAQVCSGGKRKKDEISVDCLDFNKKILHTAWHPQVRLEANNLSLLLILSQIQIFCYWSFLRPKCFVMDGFSNINIAGEHYRCRGHEQSLPLPGSDRARHC